MKIIEVMTVQILPLEQIYAEGFIKDEPLFNKDFLCIPYKGKFFCIEKQKLSVTEQKLLLTLYPNVAPLYELERKFWYQVLFKHTRLSEKEAGEYRIIQVQFKRMDDSIYHSWIQTMETVLPNLVDCLFVSSNQVLLIEKRTENYYQKEELHGLFTALDDDFATFTQIFVGAFYPSEVDFTKIYREESRLFQEMLVENPKKYLSLSDCVLYLAMSQNLNQYESLKALAKIFFVELEMKEVIHALWKNQANVSSTAKDLFMHRNTLLYKMEKFQQRFDLNLKELNDLLMVYLISNLKF